MNERRRPLAKRSECNETKEAHLLLCCDRPSDAFSRLKGVHVLCEVPLGGIIAI